MDDGAAAPVQARTILSFENHGIVCLVSITSPYLKISLSTLKTCMSSGCPLHGDIPFYLVTMNLVSLRFFALAILSLLLITLFRCFKAYKERRSH